MKKDSIKRKTVFLLFVILTIAWMAVIFGFSAKDAEKSTIQSNTVTEFIIKIFNRDFDDMTIDEQTELIDQYDRIVRKSAHFAAYAVLGFLMYFSFATLRNCKSKYKPVMLSLPLCVVFATTDEYHQTFVDGRAGRFSDILIDGSGALCGTIFAVIALSVVARLFMNKQNERGK